MSRHGRILVAMSGGIDSTVTAMMLHEEGYEVVGITMKTWDYATSGGIKKETGCCSLDSINDAREMAVKVGFHHFILDIREEFGNYVIDNFVDEYLAGRTPNPCVLCNTHIKWQALLRRADALDCAKIATGHYAQIKAADGRYFVSKSVDESKDQSYVLWGLDQECLRRSKFPIGGFRKADIRQMALDWGYAELSKKAESYEICFVPDNDYRRFLRKQVPDLAEKVGQGEYVNSDGEVIGYHQGYPFYTIGQRKGLGMACGTPKFVVNIDPATNRVVLGDVEDLIKTGMYVYKINSMKYAHIPENQEFLTKVRYHDPGALALATYDQEKIKVEFLAQVKGIAPGQSAVFYEDDDVVGGGIIFQSI